MMAISKIVTLEREYFSVPSKEFHIHVKEGSFPVYLQIRGEAIEFSKEEWSQILNDVNSLLSENQSINNPASSE